MEPTFYSGLELFSPCYEEITRVTLEQYTARGE